MEKANGNRQLYGAITGHPISGSITERKHIQHKTYHDLNTTFPFHMNVTVKKKGGTLCWLIKHGDTKNYRRSGGIAPRILKRDVSSIRA